MSYRINKTNGDLLVDLVDGQIDVTTSSITLVGRNYTGFGEAFLRAGRTGKMWFGHSIY